MKCQWKGFISGVLTTMLLVGLIGSAVAASYQKQATLNYTGIKITLDGKTVTPTDANGNSVEPFAIDGATYLPVRGIASALGLGVDWDKGTQTVKLSTGGATQIPKQTPAPTPAPQPNVKYYADTKIPMFENVASVSYEKVSDVKAGSYMYKYNIDDFIANSVDAGAATEDYLALLESAGFEMVPYDKADSVKLSNADGQTIIFSAPEPGKYFDESYLIIFASLTDPSLSSNASSGQVSQSAIGEGTYKVGTDIKAGTYQLTCTSKYGAYWARLKNASGELESIIANGNFKTTAYVTVSSGEYLKLSSCTAKLQ